MRGRAVIRRSLRQRLPAHQVPRPRCPDGRGGNRGSDRATTSAYLNRLERRVVANPSPHPRSATPDRPPPAPCAHARGAPPSQGPGPGAFAGNRYERGPAPPLGVPPPVPPSVGASTRRAIARWKAWVTTVGSRRRRATRARPRSSSVPSLSGRARRLPAATASWMARLIPTPPTGDIAWAESPMQSSPRRCQRLRRLTWTSSVFTSSQPAGSCSTLSAKAGMSSARELRSVSMPCRRRAASEPLGIT